MKNIFKFLPALAMSICFVSCDSLVDDKAVIDAKYAVQAPTLQISNLKADDYSTVSFSYTISSVEGLAVVGLEVSENSNFNNSSFFELSEFSASGSGSISGLAPSTQYYARLYACTPDNMSVSESAQVTTPSVPLTASLLTDKIYKGTFADYWGDEYNFEISFTPDTEDPYKLKVNDIEPYLAANGYNAANGVNTFNAVLDPETAIITVEIEQPVGYKSYYLVGFDAETIEECEYFDNLYIRVDNFGASITILNGYGFTDDDGNWWEIFAGPMTFKP